MSTQISRITALSRQRYMTFHLSASLVNSNCLRLLIPYLELSMDSMSSDALTSAPQWKITFLGGDADLDDSPAVLPDAASTQTPHGVRLPLAMTSVGDRVWVVQIKGGHRMARRLTDVGIAQGSEITVVSRTESGSVIVALQGCRIGLGAGMAHRVIVATTQQEDKSSSIHHQPTQLEKQGDANMPITLHPGALAVGQSGRIVGYERGSRAYREKLLSMGLTPGTHFTVTRQAPMGDPIELEVRGYKLSLRKSEAAALQIEPTTPQEVRHD